MLYQSHEIMTQQRAAARWKEWIPLITQQLRLRNLIQIVAYNVSTNEKYSNRVTDMKTKKFKTEVVKVSFYYTLHLTTMSAPFYTSEKLECENPKWAEIEVGDLTCHINAAVKGIVIRLWLHREGEPDHVITVWGVYFSGLVYLGSKPSFDPAALKLNTIVFHMHGGYFTASECIRDAPPKKRNATVKVNITDAQPSYNVNLLLRLQTIQQAIKQQMVAAQTLREKISVGSFTQNETRENTVLRRLLNKSRPKAPEREELLRIRKEMELVRFRVSMLSQEKSRKQAEMHNMEKKRLELCDRNNEKGVNLLSRYQNLNKEMEQLKEWKKSYVDMRESFLHALAQLSFRRKQLISELNLIYPIDQTTDNKFTICGVHLPNSEDFTGNDEVMISVALGFVAHLVQMISIFLQLPLRYPIIHIGSRSKIVDHVAEKIPDKDREFPLFSRGKDKLQFNYGVYLLNKNIAQLRWYFSLPTQDLRATLSNLLALLHFRPGSNMLENHHRTLSGSSLDLPSSSQNVSPVGSLQTSGFRRQLPIGAARNFEKGHRVSKSMGNSELGFQTKLSDPEVQSAKDFSVTAMTNNGTTTNLSYSLDKGLDEYEVIKKAEDTSRPLTAINPKQQKKLSHVGSEPILSKNAHDRLSVHKEHEAASSGDEAQKKYLQSWQARGPAPICSDEDCDALHGFSHMQVKDTVMAESVVESNSVENDRLEAEHISSDNISEEILTKDSKECLQDEVGVNIVNNMDNNGILVEGNWLVRTSNVNGRNGEDSVFFDNNSSIESTVRREAVGMKKLSSKEDSELEKLADLGNMIESSLMDSVLTRRTEALARRTGSFNLVRPRHSSSFEDGLS